MKDLFDPKKQRLTQKKYPYLLLVLVVVSSSSSSTTTSRVVTKSQAVTQTAQRCYNGKLSIVEAHTLKAVARKRIYAFCADLKTERLRKWCYFASA